MDSLRTTPYQTIIYDKAAREEKLAAFKTSIPEHVEEITRLLTALDNIPDNLGNEKGFYEYTNNVCAAFLSNLEEGNIVLANDKMSPEVASEEIRKALVTWQNAMQEAFADIQAILPKREAYGENLELLNSLLGEYGQTGGSNLRVLQNHFGCREFGGAPQSPDAEWREAVRPIMEKIQQPTDALLRKFKPGQDVEPIRQALRPLAHLTNADFCYGEPFSLQYEGNNKDPLRALGEQLAALVPPSTPAWARG